MPCMPLQYDTTNDILPCWIGPTVNRSDSELEAQRYSMKKNTLTVDPIILQDELWMRQHEKPSPNCQSRFSENQTAETEFSFFLNFEVGSVFRKPISDIFIGFRTSLQIVNQYCNGDSAYTQCEKQTPVCWDVENYMLKIICNVDASICSSNSLKCLISLWHLGPSIFKTKSVHLYPQIHRQPIFGEIPSMGS